MVYYFDSIAVKCANVSASSTGGSLVLFSFGGFVCIKKLVFQVCSSLVIDVSDRSAESQSRLKALFLPVSLQASFTR